MDDTYGHRDAMIELHDLGILAPKWRPAYKRLIAYITHLEAKPTDNTAQVTRIRQR